MCGPEEATAPYCDWYWSPRSCEVSDGCVRGRVSRGCSFPAQKYPDQRREEVPHRVKTCGQGLGTKRMRPSGMESGGGVAGRRGGGLGGFSWCDGGLHGNRSKVSGTEEREIRMLACWCGGRDGGQRASGLRWRRGRLELNV